MKTHLPSALLAAALLAAPATAAQWRVTALDPLHLAVQCDRTDDERAAFALTDKDRAQTGWKFDNAFYAAADRATAGRAAFEVALREGPFSVGGRPVVAHGLWKTPGSPRTASCASRTTRASRSPRATRRSSGRSSSRSRIRWSPARRRR